MTPEEGYKLAQYQRPGFKVVMGATEARDVQIDPISDDEYMRLPGDESWFIRKIRLWLGFRPSHQSMLVSIQVMLKTGRPMTREEWIWLNNKTTGRREIKKWLESLKQKEQSNET